jgi:hypothetical protein
LLCLIAAGIYAFGGSSQAVILLAIPMVALQVPLINRLSRQDAREVRLENPAGTSPLSRPEPLLQQRQ